MNMRRRGARESETLDATKICVRKDEDEPCVCVVVVVAGAAKRSKCVLHMHVSR